MFSLKGVVTIDVNVVPELIAGNSSTWDSIHLLRLEGLHTWLLIFLALQTYSE
jgi:hypothetical protein